MLIQSVGKMMVQFSLPSKLVGSRGSLSLKRPKKQTRGISVSAWANLWMEWREKFWWEHSNGIDGGVRYGATLRWSSIDLRRILFWSLATISIITSTYSLGPKSLKIWLLSNVQQVMMYIHINYDFYTLVVELGAGNIFFMSDQLWHSTPFPHSTLVIMVSCAYQEKKETHQRWNYMLWDHNITPFPPHPLIELHVCTSRLWKGISSSCHYTVHYTIPAHKQNLWLLLRERYSWIHCSLLSAHLWLYRIRMS